MNPTQVKLAAHLGVQTAISNDVEPADYAPYSNWKKNPNAKRAAILNELARHGYGKFLLVDVGNQYLLESIYRATRVDDEEQWHSCDIYNASEVQAYLTYIGSTESPLDYMTREYNYEGYGCAPGGNFHRGTYIEQKRNRIIIYSSGGIDC